LAEASGVGIELDREAIPVHPAVDETAAGTDDRFEMATQFGEDFELLCAVPESAVAAAADACPAGLTRIGTVVESPDGDADPVTADGEPLADKGYTHGGE